MRKKVESETLERLPPHSNESEQGCLGCCLISPKEAIPESIEYFGGIKDVHYDQRHQVIWDTLVEMFNHNEPVDLITVQQALKRKQMLEECGGIAYLSALQDIVPSAANLSAYNEVILEKYQLRKMVSVCTNAVTSIYETSTEPQKIIDTVEKNVMEVRRFKSDKEGQSNFQAIQALTNKINSAMTNGVPAGLSTGISDLDLQMGGMENQEVIIIAARPSVGKTSLAMNIVEHLTINENLPCYVFSLEMSREALLLRLACSMAEVDSKRLRFGNASQEEIDRVSLAFAQITKLPLYIHDGGGLPIDQLHAIGRRAVQKHGIKLFVIDHLQLLHASQRYSSLRESMTSVSNGVKAFAKEMNTPVILLSQITRESSKNNRPPCLTDLLESGAIEQDGDKIFFLHTIEENEEFCFSKVSSIMAKNRNSDCSSKTLGYWKKFTRFGNLAKDKE